MTCQARTAGKTKREKQMADFISGFWNMYVMVLVALSILFCVFVLVSNMTKREKGPIELHGHVWDEKPRPATAMAKVCWASPPQASTQR